MGAMNKTDGSAAILIVDQDRVLADKISESLGKKGLLVYYAASVEQGLVLVGNTCFDAVLVRDELNGGIDGGSIVAFQTGGCAPEVIVFTSQGNPEQAEKAIRFGAWEYLADPSPENALPDIVRRALHYRKNKTSEATQERQAIRAELEKTGIIGRSDLMQRCIDQAIVIAQSDANVLIYGESGTGKELFASTIHELSPRASGPLTIVDCAALPPSLIESILFGHLKGSFTGADRAQPGLVEQADGGTLFLDEIGEIPPAMQKKLLRVIQERTYLPVGSRTERKSNFRLIAASNRDLQEMVTEGRFREDLLFRLKTFYLELPPLRSRVSDITELSYYYRDLFCREQKLKRKKFSPEFLLLLTQHDWPGNVRELFQALERSISEALESDVLYPIHLPPEVRIQLLQKKLAGSPGEFDGSRDYRFLTDTSDATFPTLKAAREEAVEQCEKTYLAQLLRDTDEDIKRCCEIANLSRSRFYDLLKKYGLSQRTTVLSRGK
jgi:two-component system NtrC family response regulator